MDKGEGRMSEVMDTEMESDLNKELNDATRKILIGAHDFREKLQTIIDAILDESEEEQIRLQFTMAAISMIYGASSCLNGNINKGVFNITDIIKLTNQYEKEFMGKNLDLMK